MKEVYNDGHSSVALENDGELIVIKQYLGKDFVGEITLFHHEAKRLLRLLGKELEE